jgi:glutathione S-transferase
MTNPTVYWISGSAPAWRVLLGLEFKKVKYQSQLLQTSKKEQKEDWFLAINPRGQIPVLQDGETVVTESQAILRYLEMKFPDPGLFGSTPRESATIEQSIQEILGYCDPALSAFIQPVFRNRIDQHRTELPDIGKSIESELAGIESEIGNTSTLWIAGEFSAADIMLVPTIQRLLRAIKKEPDVAAEIGLGDFDSRYPALTMWNTAVENLPMFESTYPPHWKESDLTDN